MQRRNLFLLLAATYIYAAINPAQANASVTVNPSAPFVISATLQFDTPQKPVIDNRAIILKKYLQQYDSPLAQHADTFVKEADKYNLDWKLVAAISGVESYYGQMIPLYSYNGWGYNVYDSNVGRFSSWDDGISAVSKALREEYMNARGADNVYEIGATYAADPMWAGKVTHFMDEITSFEQDNTPMSPLKTSLSISL